MKKIFLFGMLSLFCCQGVNAQASRSAQMASMMLSSGSGSSKSSTMTDNQVLQYYISATKQGKSQADIVAYLMQKGVTVDQIRRVRDNYEKSGSSGGSSSSSAGSSNSLGSLGGLESSLRSNNGELATKGTSDLLNARTVESIYDEADSNYEYIEEQVENQDSLAYMIKGKRVFGRDIFNNKVLSFAPAMNIATPANYVLGPGDNLVVELYGASQNTYTPIVSPDGMITITGYGPIQVGGLTVAAAQAKIRKTLGARHASSQINVTVGQTRTITIHVVGEVRVPGTFTLSAFSTAFNALYMAGGINGVGTLRNIKVFRNGKVAAIVDVYDYILNGKLGGNIPLADNDVIIVGPYDCLVDMTGKVKRPMCYEMKKDESLASLLKYAGGFAGDAYTKTVRVLRKSGSGYSVHTVNEFDLASFKLADGDSASVDSILPRFENMVEIRGAVFRPGMYQVGQDINSVRTLIEHADGVTEDAFTARAVMHRMKPDRTLEVVSVDVAGIMNGTTPDIPLQNEDVLFIPTQTEMQTARTITIHGEVQNPGIYYYADNESIEDFIMQAGGLTNSASLVKVDVARRIHDPKATTSNNEIARTYSFTIKDGFVIDGKPGFILQPYDEVFVRKSPGYQEQRNVYLEGEVLFAGTYTLSKKNQRLSEVITAAGGVTSEAYLKGARLERQINEYERMRMEEVMQLASMSKDNKDTLSTQKLNIGDIYYVGIQLDKALENPGGDADIVLREGDRIIVPEYVGTVRVSGDVMFPNTISYSHGKKSKWYINHAGGYGTRAKRSKAFVVYQNGDVARVRRGAKIEPGCEIIVPTKPQRSGNALTEWVSIGTSIASLATMFATIANLIK